MAFRRLGLVLSGVLAACVCLVSCKPVPPGTPGASREGKPELSIERTPYGKLPDGRRVDLYTLTNANGLRVKIMNYGATTVGVEVPDRDGKLGDVTLGYETLEGWLTNTSYFGATAGRYANRIAKGKFTLDGKTYSLAINNGPNHLHGGIVGFNNVLWDAEPVGGEGYVGIKFTYVSKDGEEGYPGNLTVTAVYSLTNANEFKAEYSATTDKPTVVNLAHHTYWNLGTPAAGDILRHELMLDADRFTPVDAGLIPTGELRAVKGTPFDFTTPTAIGARIAAENEQLKFGNGYDHNFVLRGEKGKLRLAARLSCPESGRVMEILSGQPAIQFYSGNFLDGTVKGKGGVVYEKNYGLCLETQTYPDSPNKPDFPSPVLRPGETYKHTMVHRFSTR